MAQGCCQSRRPRSARRRARQRGAGRQPPVGPARRADVRAVLAAAGAVDFLRRDCAAIALSCRRTTTSRGPASTSCCSLRSPPPPTSRCGGRGTSPGHRRPAATLLIVDAWFDVLTSGQSRSDNGNRLCGGHRTAAVGTVLVAESANPSDRRQAAGAAAFREQRQPAADHRLALLRRCGRVGRIAARAMVWNARLKPTTAGLTESSTSRPSTSSACTAKTYLCARSPAGGAAPA